MISMALLLLIKPLGQFIKQILAILLPGERVKMGVLILFNLVISGLDIVFLGGLLFIINFYTSGNTGSHLFLPGLFGQNNSLLAISLFFVLFALKNGLGYFIFASGNRFFYQVALRLSRQNLLNYLKGSHKNFIQVDSSVYIRQISQQPIEFSNYILTNLQEVITQAVLILFTIIAILFYHPTLFLLLFLVLLPPVFLLGLFIRRKLSRIRASTKVTAEKVLQHLHESIAGFTESNIYNKDEFFTSRYYAYQKQLNDNISTQQSLQGLPSRLIEVFAILGFFILILLSKIYAGRQVVDLLSIGIFMAASYKIIPGVVKILNSTGQIKTYRFILVDLLTLSPPADTGDHGLTSQPITSLEFKQVKFKYKTAEILKGLSFKIAPGDFVGISGDSGMGKTTIINLLLGFLQPDCGAIHINNLSTTNRERQNYFGRVSYVKQQPFFINDSILKNVTLAEEGHDADKLTQVMQFCGIDAMLSHYPEGLNKLITENGKNVSGGQRQRMMLARALYHDFDLLILDEPFAEMDKEAEESILLKLKSLANKGKMIVLITHNKASLSFCNQVILLND
jgi:ABC-type bacteriocin/lantibiotic exporter with double-glycine peptidase domain